ncbi:MAG: helix-turn-helix domain-containing protein [Candidatus Nanopelagicales bacterium]
MNTEAYSSHGATTERNRRARVLSALGDPIRLAVVDLLRVQDLSPDALAAALEVPGNLLAHHVKVLEDAGVVDRRHSQGDRRRTYVHLINGALAGLLSADFSYEAPRVVFVCTENSARSVIAEVVWNSVSDVPAVSAGTHPAEHVNAKARAAAERHGLSIDHFPQSVDEVLQAGDLIISVCDTVNEELTPQPRSHIHWSVRDPASAGTDEAFNETFAELLSRIVQLSPRVHSESPLVPRKAPR